MCATSLKQGRPRPTWMRDGPAGHTGTESPVTTLNLLGMMATEATPPALGLKDKNVYIHSGRTVLCDLYCVCVCSKLAVDRQDRNGRPLGGLQPSV